MNQDKQFYLDEAKAYNEIDNFKDQLEFLKNKEHFCLMLDNDGYYIMLLHNDLLSDDEEEECLLNHFNIDGDFGDREGVFNLFEALGIKCSGV